MSHPLLKKGFLSPLSFHITSSKSSISFCCRRCEQRRRIYLSIKHDTRHVLSLSGDEALREVALEGGSIRVDGLFIAMGTALAADFATKLGMEMNGIAIVVDDEQKLLQGIFAAGDCTGGFRQISTAVGRGAVAWKSIISYLRSPKRVKAS